MPETRRIGRWIARAVVLFSLLAAASAHGAGLSQHAVDHAALRAAQDARHAWWDGLSPPQQRNWQQRQMRITRRADRKPAALVGRWSAPRTITTSAERRGFAIHAALLHTGRVLFWGTPLGVPGQAPNVGRAFLYDPDTARFRDVDPPGVDLDGDGVDEGAAPVYCSGQSFLADGRLLVTGGNLRWPAPGTHGYLGADMAFTFDPRSGRWARQPDMGGGGRWYPSQVLLADGRTLVTNGYLGSDPGSVHNRTSEVFTDRGPGARGAFRPLPHADSTAELYPHLFLLPDGDVFMGGPGRADSALLRPTGPRPAWEPVGHLSRTRLGGNTVMLPGGHRGSWRFMTIGGYARRPTHGAPAGAATATTEQIDLAARRRWRPASDQRVARSYANTVILPTGDLVTVGGGSGRTPEAGVRGMWPDGRSRQVELRDADTGHWRLGAAQAEDRGYHSVALLLPDGRVLSAGDDINPDSESDTIELYSPPYLFTRTGRPAPRPEILSAPRRTSWGRQVTVRTSDDVTRAVLVAPSATTHGADMTQRLVELPIVASEPGASVTLRAPLSPGAAAPGRYMLFLLDRYGTPSVARWLRLAP